MCKYRVVLASGRDCIIDATDDEEAAYEALELASGWYDDYLVDLEPICDV